MARIKAVDRTVQTAQDLGYDEESVKQIRESFKKKDGKETEPNWVSEEMTSQLFITKTDGGALSFPIRTNSYFRKGLCRCFRRDQHLVGGGLKTGSNGPFVAKCGRCRSQRDKFSAAIKNIGRQFSTSCVLPGSSLWNGSRWLH